MLLLELIMKRGKDVIQLKIDILLDKDHQNNPKYLHQLLNIITLIGIYFQCFFFFNIHINKKIVNYIDILNFRISQDGRINAPRRYVASSPTAGAPPPPSTPQHLSAYDYVTSRIVEVMRTEDELKRPGSLISATGDNNPSGTPPPPLAYPYSALNVSGLSTGAGGANATDSPTEVSRPPTLPSQEPKPLMSSQYEPLSDED